MSHSVVANATAGLGTSRSGALDLTEEGSRKSHIARPTTTLFVPGHEDGAPVNVVLCGIFSTISKMCFRHSISEIERGLVYEFGILTPAVLEHFRRRVSWKRGAR